MRCELIPRAAWVLALLLGVGVGCSDPAGTLGPTSDLPATEAEGAGAVADARDGHGAPAEPPPGPGSGSPAPPPVPVAATLPESVGLALDRECLAWTLYLRIQQELGPGTPFDNIAAAEEQHVGSLAALYAKRDLPVPACPFTPDAVEVPDFASLAEACAFAAAGETALLALYDGLLQPELPQDAATVFSNLRAATADHHLPAFERCAGL